MLAYTYVYASFLLEKNMGENEKRRIEILEQMRNNSTPVIHPRYRATYNSLYQNEGKQNKKSSFFSIILIIFFIGIGYYTYTEKPVIDTGYIIERIEQEVERFIDFTISD